MVQGSDLPPSSTTPSSTKKLPASFLQAPSSSSVRSGDTKKAKVSHFLSSFDGASRATLDSDDDFDDHDVDDVDDDNDDVDDVNARRRKLPRPSHHSESSSSSFSSSSSSLKSQKSKILQLEFSVFCSQFAKVDAALTSDDRGKPFHQVSSPK